MVDRHYFFSFFNLVARRRISHSVLSMAGMTFSTCSTILFKRVVLFMSAINSRRESGGHSNGFEPPCPKKPDQSPPSQYAGRNRCHPFYWRWEPHTSFRCCANCRHYVPPQYTTMLDGPPSGYCRHPKRVGGRYIMDSWSVSEAGLYREPGEGCDDLFEGNVRDDV